MPRASLLLLLACATTPMATMQSLTRVDVAGTTSDCPAGGVTLSTGVDQNDNAVLDEDEITSSQPVCAGPAGPSGDVTRAVARTTPEPEGSQCPHGGVKIELGIDDNGDGALDEGEIASTAYSCSSDPFANIFVGTLELRTPADVAAAQRYETIFGDLVIAMTAPAAVSLPNLTLVQGAIKDCTGTPSQATSLTFERLASAGAIRLSCSRELSTLRLPELSFTQEIVLSEAPFTTTELPKLSSVAGDVTIDDTGLTALPMPALMAVGGLLTLQGNALMQDCDVIDAVHARRAVGADLQLVASNIACVGVAGCPVVPIGEDDSHRLCYYRENWEAAQARCETIGVGWRLSYMRSDDELGALTGSSILAAPRSSVWIGYTDRAVEGVSSWAVSADGTTGPTSWVNGPTGYAPQTGSPFWAGGEPNNYAGTEDCVFLRSFGSALTANDTNCEDERYALCRYFP